MSEHLTAHPPGSKKLRKWGRTTHGLSHTRAYHRWKSMLQRCFNPNAKDYPYYGGAGVGVDEPWLKFENYYADTGDPPPGLSLDRYPNKYGNYGPGNWRWATRFEQIHNRRPSKRKKRRATAEEIRAFAASMARAASLPVNRESAP